MVMGRVSSVMKTIAYKVLDLGDEKLNEQYNLLKEASRSNKYDLEVKELKELITVLKTKHAVENIIVSYNNGSLLASSNGPDLKEAVTGTALLSYINSEIPKSEAVFIQKSKGWYMLYPHGKKVYIVHAANNLHSVELRAIAQDLEKFLKKHAD